jgi:hypothetical protein
MLTDKGVWYPDAAITGDGSMGCTLGSTCSDDRYAKAFVDGKFGEAKELGIGATSVSVWIENGYLYMSYTKCALPS